MNKIWIFCCFLLVSCASTGALKTTQKQIKEQLEQSEHELTIAKQDVQDLHKTMNSISETVNDMDLLLQDLKTNSNDLKSLVTYVITYMRTQQDQINKLRKALEEAGQ